MLDLVNRVPENPPEVVVPENDARLTAKKAAADATRLTKLFSVLR